MIKTLVVEGNPDHARLIAQHLEQVGKGEITAQTCHQISDALASIEEDSLDVVLVDWRLPDCEGVDAIATLAAKAPNLPIVVVFPREDEDHVLEALRAGAQDVLSKSRLSGDRMVRTLRVAIQRMQLQKQMPSPDHALRESEARIQAIINASLDCIITMDPDGKILQFNPAAEKTFGYSSDEVINKEMGELFVPPSVQERQRRSFRLFQATGAGSMLGRRVEVPAFRKDGTEFIAEMATQPVTLEGELVFTVFLRDITARKKAEDAVQREIAERQKVEEELRRERDLLRTLMDHLPDFIFSKDTEGHFVTANAELARALKVGSPQELVGKTDFDFFPKELAERYREDDFEVMRSGEPMINREEKGADEDGREHWLLTTKVPLRDKQGKVEGLVGMSRDITDRIVAQKQLEEAKEAAEAASKAKSDFLANMSHEIRTPMNAVIGMTELLLETQLTKTQREYLSMVDESGAALLDLINDILDFSKIESGKFELEKAEFDLPESVGQAMKTLAVRAHRKNLELACRFSPEVPNVLVGDVSRLRQVIINLVGNAIKFTEDGEVVLTIEPETANENQVALHFAVKDTGIGIPQEKLDAIFEAFEQADISMTRRFGGTGLGLAISSRLVELAGGRMWVESELGEGSTFHFTMELGIGEAEPETELDPVVVGGTPVLVVDDNQTNRIILKEILQNWGMKPTLCDSADAALAKLLDEGSTDDFRVLITDVHMPDTDGFQLAARVREEPRLADLAIIVLTSGDRPGDLARCEELKIDAHMLKPVNQSELFNAIVRILQVTAIEDEAEAEQPEAQATEPLEGLNVLLAEDTLVNQKLAIGLLKKHGHKVTVANNGREAVELLESQDFDVVLMDVQMPELDGMEATRIIRQREQQSGGHVPIIALTAHALKGDREQCLEAGMDDYLSKPIRSKDLYEKLNKFHSKQPAAEETDPEANQTGSDSALDWEGALRTTGGDKELLREIMTAFLDEGPKLITDLQKASDEGDAARLRRAAHTLKGSMTYFCAERARDLAYQLESMGKNGELANTSETATQLAAEIKKLVGELEKFTSE